MTRTAAFFDFDRTLIAADSQREEALSLLKKHLPGLLYPFRLLKVVAAEPLYKRNTIEHDLYNRLYLTSYKGIPLSKLRNHGRTLYKTRLKPLLFQEMLALMEAHRNCGHLVIVVSATSSHLIEPFIEESNPDAWVATAIETNANGICTGRPDGKVCVGKEKARAMQRIAEGLGIDLEASHAYSDHHADLEFLEAVGNPTVVNPTPILAEIASERTWQVKRIP